MRENEVFPKLKLQRSVVHTAENQTLKVNLKPSAEEEDGDSEDFNVAEMMVHTRLAASNKRPDNLTVPSAPKSRIRKKLNSIVNHSKRLRHNTETPCKLSKIINGSSSPHWCF